MASNLINISLRGLLLTLDRGVEALTSMFFLTPQKRAAPAA